MKIQVILGSTRPGRLSERVAKWVQHSAQQVPDLEVDLVDLADYAMPFLDEAISPRFNPHRTPNEPVQRWLAKVAPADGYIIVSPEYNRAMPGVLKNALDYLGHELDRKPVLLVTHGSTGGSSAADNLRLTLRGVGAVTTPEAVALTDRASNLLNEQGELEAAAAAQAYGPKAALARALDSLAWWTKTLKAGRHQA